MLHINYSKESVFLHSVSFAQEDIVSGIPLSLFFLFGYLAALSRKFCTYSIVFSGVLVNLGDGLGAVTFRVDQFP